MEARMVKCDLFVKHKIMAIKCGCFLRLQISYAFFYPNNLFCDQTLTKLNIK